MKNEDNLHDIPLFPNTHPDTWLGGPRKRLLLPHGWSGHVGGHDSGSTTQYTTIIFNRVERRWTDVWQDGPRADWIETQEY